MMNKQMIKRVIVIVIAVCVVLALILPLFVKADIAIGGDVNYLDADYYVTADGPDGYVKMYYGPGLEYGWDYEIENGEKLHIIETADNIYDQLRWGQAEQDEFNRWVRLDHTQAQESVWETLVSQIRQLFIEIMKLLRTLR